MKNLILSFRFHTLVGKADGQLLYDSLVGIIRDRISLIKKNEK